MIRWIILACLVVVLTVAGTVAVMYAPDASIEPAIELHHRVEGPPPKLEVVGSPEFNFGTMPKRSNGAHSWEIKNVGEGVLDLWLEETSCSCTVAKLTDDTDKEKVKGREPRPAPAGEKKIVKVPPGMTTPLEVTWETRDWTNFGQTVSLGTNDPDRPSFALVIRGKVLLPVAVEPSDTVTFANASNEESHRAAVTVVSPDHAGLKLTKVTSSKPGLIVAETRPMTPEELATTKVKAGYHVSIELKPGMPLGSFHEELVIETDHPDQSEVKVAIVGKVTGPISVYPEKLEMYNVASREGASRNLSLVVRGGRETRFEVVRAPEQVKVDIVPDDKATDERPVSDDGHRAPGTPAGFIDQRIVVKSDHPQVGQIEIPLKIYISRASGG